MPIVDFREGSKKQVAEIKFLIHDLRVERFVNSIIHFHVTLNADLEIFNIEQALALHSDDLSELKEKAKAMRRALRDYSSAVKSFSPDKIIIAAGRTYIETVQEVCELILNPLWGRFDRVISFLPDEARSVRARNHYRNAIRWICGVYYRIEYFFQDLDHDDVREEFDVGHDIIDYTNNIIFGYIVEKGQSRVEIQIDRQGDAVVYGSRPRFRRMYFNLIMNAVDALQEKRVGLINVVVRSEAERVALSVGDNGVGMYPDKIKHLLRDLDTLDGELHSLGFVFVRQTVDEWAGELQIDSHVGKGSTITIWLPCLPGRKPPPRRKSRCGQYAIMPFADSSENSRASLRIRQEADSTSSEADVQNDPFAFSSPDMEHPHWDVEDEQKNCGRILMRDHQISKARARGCIFAMGVTYEGRVEAFAHQPYEEYWDISHEDLNPMLYDSTIRGRLEHDEKGAAYLILKEPHSASAYFDLKDVRTGRSPERYATMIHDEYILLARKLIDTGMKANISVYVTNPGKYLHDHKEDLGDEPFPLERLAALSLSIE
jgi:hypothetical protein